MTSDPYRTAGEPADAAVALLLAREIASDDTASYVDQPAATILARALLAAHEENERLCEHPSYKAVSALRSALKEALDALEGLDLSDYAHSGNGYRGNFADLIAALRKLL